MKMLATTFWVLGGGILFASAAQGPSTTPQRAKFRIEIRAATEKSAAAEKKGPTFAVTNLTGKTVTACVFELSYASPGKRSMKTIWDALLDGNPPIEPGATILRPLMVIGGSPLPNKGEVIAGVWDDGETFGQTVLANNILKNRALRASEYDDAAAILQQGLKQNWRTTSISRLLATSQTPARSIPCGPRWQQPSNKVRRRKNSLIPCNSCCRLSDNSPTNFEKRSHTEPCHGW